MRATLIVLTLALFHPQIIAQRLEWHRIEPQTDASFRALSVVDDSIAWVAGSMGWVGRSVDGGVHWSFNQVKGFQKFDFRSLYAFDARSAVIANAGAPANILRTEDGGQTWKVVHTINDSSAFLDGVDFWDLNNGIIYGDPINGRMLLLSTNDGGRTWKEFSNESRPLLKDGEASFAASGTTIRCVGSRTVVIATGGKASRLWRSEDRGKNWKVSALPVIQGESSTGVFSFSGFRGKHAVIVGGDYLRDTLRLNHAFYTTDKGRKWLAPPTPTRGYRECVEFIGNDTLLATGPTGTDISLDNGQTWLPESDERLFHVVRKARNGELIIIAGGRGQISLVKH